MWLRKILLAAAVAVPLAWSPAPADAQEHGRDRAETATQQADEVAGWTHKNTPKPVKDLPPGIARQHEEGRPLPPGIRRNRNAPEPDAQPEPEVQQDPEPEPEPEVPEECATTIVFIDFQPYLQDCNGTLFPL